ncbi:HigA family addiction module antitoxin [Methylobacterium sp. J-090]|uniref:HigA family addiction module antitoxin n=1 Tax=Methylobacterium sp. J-090 TaxID=2836666 RepID=UPI001FB954DA|nr:HigA family addiction module antitoxin [Methylobacterium sp. J-090]MCJ2082514.1 HigA family addiction module antitoxin [Methylobacterium sp. J-090]
MSIVLATEEILPPLHPGEVLREEFLIPLGLTAGAVARACGVPRTRIERVASEDIGLTTDTALRLGRYFGTTAGFWLNLQKRFELETLERAIGPDLDRITPLARDAA